MFVEHQYVPDSLLVEHKNNIVVRQRSSRKIKELKKKKTTHNVWVVDVKEKQSNKTENKCSMGGRKLFSAGCPRKTVRCRLEWDGCRVQGKEIQSLKVLKKLMFYPLTNNENEHKLKMIWY